MGLLYSVFGFPVLYYVLGLIYGQPAALENSNEVPWFRLR
jgi:hypothetical protein